MDTASRSENEITGRVGVRAGISRSLALWLLVLALSTLLLWGFRQELHEAHKTLAYLLVVLGASARSGRFVGLTIAIVSFLAFNFFLLPPYYTFNIEEPLNWWILVGFLVTGAVAAQLFHRTQRALATAERRAREIERLTVLAAESLAAPSAVDAVASIARVIRAELGVRCVQVIALASGEPMVLARAPDGSADEPDPRHVRRVIDKGGIVTIGTDGSSRGVALPGVDLGSSLADDRSIAAILVPLRIRDRTIGILELMDPAGLRLDPGQALFADALMYYAALAVDRARLAAQAEHVVALREADRLKDALLASVSHDLRTPLTTIRALAAELRSTGDERAIVIEEEAERLNRLVTDLLDLSRIKGGALAMEPQVIAAEDLVGAALQRVAGLPGSERIEVKLPTEGIPIGRFDFVHALRALVNLLENALRHSPPDQVVGIEITEEGEELVFRILDRGPGIAEADRARVFEPFFRAGSQASEATGAGLGLTIAFRMAEAQGGGLRYVPRPGGGSAFELRLPSEALDELC